MTRTVAGWLAVPALVVVACRSSLPPAKVSVLDPSIFTNDSGEAACEPAPMRRIEGSLVLYDERGQIHRTESGTFVVDVVFPPLPDSAASWCHAHVLLEVQKRRRVVQIENGRWSLEIDAAVVALQPSQFELIDRAPMLDQSWNALEIPADGEVRIEATSSSTSSLHVRPRALDEGTCAGALRED